MSGFFHSFPWLIHIDSYFISRLLSSRFCGNRLSGCTGCIGSLLLTTPLHVNLTERNDRCFFIFVFLMKICKMPWKDIENVLQWQNFCKKKKCKQKLIFLCQGFAAKCPFNHKSRKLVKIPNIFRSALALPILSRPPSPPHQQKKVKDTLHQLKIKVEMEKILIAGLSSPKRMLISKQKRIEWSWNV